jgi:hypothetical protein
MSLSHHEVRFLHGVQLEQYRSLLFSFQAISQCHRQVRVLLVVGHCIQPKASPSNLFSFQPISRSRQNSESYIASNQNRLTSAITHLDAPHHVDNPIRYTAIYHSLSKRFSKAKRRNWSEGTNYVVGDFNDPLFPFLRIVHCCPGGVCSLVVGF